MFGQNRGPERIGECAAQWPEWSFWTAVHRRQRPPRETYPGGPIDQHSALACWEKCVHSFGGDFWLDAIYSGCDGNATINGMTEAPKMHQVADAVHVTIPITGFEKDVVSTVLFNRLHNILQNSTFYFTCPSCRTSRFSHSLGAMHLAGELFRASIQNSDHSPQRPDCQLFLNFVKAELNQIVASDSFISASRNNYKIEATLPRIPEDAVYNRNTPSFLTEEEQTIYCILFQSIRFYGLLHDLGHPPFSHVTEDALLNLFKGLKDKKEPTKRQKEFLDIIGTFRTDGPDEKRLHEVASKELIGEVFQKVIDSSQRHVAQYRFFIQLVVLSIMETKSPYLGLLHKLVDGDLDADRLDFTSRDLISTGLGKSLPYERIVNTFTLFKDQDDQFHFLPSVRSLYSTETFFASRFDLYRFGVYHHRVRKFDTLFREAIVAVASAYLEKPDEPTPLSGRLLPHDISGLWHVLSSSCRHLAPDVVADYYSQWDDAWLLKVLRQEYFSGSPTEILEAQLDEILSNKKHYWPLFKRPECFVPIDRAFLKKGKDLFANRRFWTSFTAMNEAVKAELRELSKQDIMKAGSSLPTEFFLTVLAQNMTVSFTSILRHALRRLATDPHLNVANAIAVEKILKAGIKDLKILTEDGAQDIGSVSNIRHALETDAKLFPPFFVFILPQKPRDTLDIPLIRERLGQFLFAEFESATSNQGHEHVQRNRRQRKAPARSRLRTTNLHGR